MSVRKWVTPMGFIEDIAKYVQKYAPQYGIAVCSPIIAQSVLESQYGQSELAVNAHNYFGLKYRSGRCPTASGIYYKVGSEQNADGTYTSSAMQWMKFDNMEKGVQGYFDFINIPNYAALKGITDPLLYLQTIKDCKYATSINYVQNVYKVIEKWDLTKYDKFDNIVEPNDMGETKMIINVHAGHNPDGKTACGAVGLIKESTEARNVKNEVINQLRKLGHTVYDCTADDGTSVSDVLKKIVTKCNAHDVDLDVSIHFNSGANNKGGDGKTTGTEVLVYSTSSQSVAKANDVCNAISKLGFKNRGVKTRPDLYFLKNTKAPAMLVECCFVDDKDDVQLYDYKEVATAIVYGITGKYVVEKIEKEDLPSNAETTTSSKKTLYRVQVGAYGVKENAEIMAAKLKKAGFDCFITKA